MKHNSATQHFAHNNVKQKIFLFIGLLSCIVLAVNF